jgi:hypothetical protein
LFHEKKMRCKKLLCYPPFEGTVSTDLIWPEVIWLNKPWLSHVTPAFYEFLTCLESS